MRFSGFISLKKFNGRSDQIFSRQEIKNFLILNIIDDWSSAFKYYFITGKSESLVFLRNNLFLDRI